MTNVKEWSVLTKSNIHSNKVFSGRQMKTLITTLMKGIPNKHTCLSPRGNFDLIRVETMNICGTPKHTKGNLTN